MSNRVIKKVVSGRFKKLRKLGNRIEAHFIEEDIHGFRVEVKKLRAFLRMIALELKDPDELKLPGKLRKIYGKAGEIRDRQLQLKRIGSAVETEAVKPEAYISSLEHQVIKSKKQLRELLATDPIPAMEKKILGRLPGSISHETVRGFVHQKLTVIKLLILSQHEHDEDLHTIRKNLKDLMYDLKAVEDELQLPIDEFLEGFHLKTLEKLAQDLGQFNDMSFALLFLKPDYLDGVDLAERLQLRLIRDQWLQEKDQLRQAALEALGRFHSAAEKVQA